MEYFTQDSECYWSEKIYHFPNSNCVIIKIEDSRPSRESTIQNVMFSNDFHRICSYVDNVLLMNMYVTATEQ